MIRVMIPTFRWEDEDWYLLEIKSLGNAKQVLINCDGGVQNVILDCDKVGNVEKTMKELFKNIPWLNKVFIKNYNSVVGIYENKK